ncbi:hypothetical protein D0T49_03600 [Paludibacter sp. 221]|uniref:hypothetical protein n=1 Tax=Paludibacter sp. 221 TaxID=2302939 RepID=UPI0013CFB511|nr:hypothetical protein [Paludibacter sp. 221]NDV46125.1 hypothetical protein [Paludibacter sp. 221]
MKTLQENTVINYFDKKYGTDVERRYRKLQEEVNELHIEMLNRERGMDNTDRIIDELSDSFAVLLHLAYCIGMEHKKDLCASELLRMAYEKNKIRESNPEYKRH